MLSDGIHYVIYIKIKTVILVDYSEIHLVLILLEIQL